MKHVVGLSGGKDSVAMSLRLRELHPDIDFEYICTPTGNELPELFDHLQNLEDLLGKPIKRLGVGLDLYQLIEEQQMIPNYRARFCTRVLKIEPTIEYMRALPEGSVLYVGLRADEPVEKRGGIYGDLVTSVYPMREWGWTIEDVWAYLGERGVKIPKRTDCGVCFYQRLGEWWNLWRFNPEFFAEGEKVEELIGHTFRSDGRDSWPASLADLRQRFERGEIPRGANVQGSLLDDSHIQCRVCSL